MIIDKSLIYSEDQDITATAASTNALDHVKAGFPYKDAMLYVKVGTTFTNLTSLAIAFQDSADNSTFATLFSKTVLAADLTAGAKVLQIPLPAGVRRYTRMYYTVTGSAPDAGDVYAAIVPDAENRVDE